MISLTNLFLFILIFFNHSILLYSKVNTTIDHAITVFVHGTFPARKLLQYSPGRSLIYFPKGLSLAENISKKYHFHQVAKGCIDLSPDLYSFDQFYIFGWKSEHVYDHVRAEAANDLIYALQKIVDDYYQLHQIVPKVRLIGFSHGGNVVLHTANALPLIVQSKTIEVEVWIFGTPVQQVNQHLINSNNFSKVYSIYSKNDWIQRMDPQGLRNPQIRKKHFWSDRIFSSESNCIQIEFTVNQKSIGHTSYRSVFKYFPIIQKLVLEKTQDIKTGFIAVDLKRRFNSEVQHSVS